jgi:hypothetical protein
MENFHDIFAITDDSGLICWIASLTISDGVLAG